MRHRHRFSFLFGRAVALCGALWGLSGCGLLGYQYAVVLGELDLLSRAVPIEQALADPGLTPDQIAKLELVIRARDYGQEVVGLNVGNSYQTFVNLHGRPLAWNLSASRKDRFEPYYWHLIIGPIPYLGFFEQSQAIRERDRLVSAGYDTVMYEIDAFSTLGRLPDPVTSAMLNREIGSLADTVLHELTHNTISKFADTNFNETLATFVGRTAALDFLAFAFGPDDQVVVQTRESNEDSDRLTAFLRTLYDELNVLYGSDRSSDQKIAQREGIVQAAQERFLEEILPQMHQPEVFRVYGTLGINNAFLLLNIRYNDGLDVFEGIHELTGRNWGQTLSLFSQAAARDDSIGFLRGVLAASGL